MKIMYMGTPRFAALVLEKIKNEFPENNICVVTKVDTPKGRSMKLCESDTAVKAHELGLTVYKPENLKRENFEEILNSEAPDIIVVAAYGKILPEYVLNYPKYKCVNVHGSILPEYRGAAPVNRAIIDGKTKTGITIMYMEKGLDTGDMLKKEEVGITEDMTASMLFDSLAEVGGRLVSDTIRDIVRGDINPEKQDDSKSTYAEKISAEECEINWNSTPFEIVRKIHGLSEEPGAFTHTEDGKLVKIYLAKASDEKFDAPVGTLVNVKKKTIQVAAKDGSVLLLNMLVEGSKRMNAPDIVNGRKLPEGMKLI